MTLPLSNFRSNHRQSETEATARDGLRVAADDCPAHRAPLWRTWHHQSPPDAPLRLDPDAVRLQLSPQPPDRHRGVVPHAVDEPLPMHGLRRLQQCPKNSLIRMCEPRHTGFTAKLAPLHVEEHGADPHAATVAPSARRRASISRQRPCQPIPPPNRTNNTRIRSISPIPPPMPL